MIDDDHDGYTEFLRVQIGVSTSGRNCTLGASVADSARVYIGSLEMLQDSSGGTFSAYIEASLFQSQARGVFRFNNMFLKCGNQSVPLLTQEIITGELDTSKFRKPFTVALSGPVNKRADHVEYWINCVAKTPLRFPLSSSVLSAPRVDIRFVVEPKTAPCTDHAFKVTVDAAPGIPTGNYEEVPHIHAPGGGVWSGEEVRVTWKQNEAPVLLGVNPSQGVGPEGHFHVAAADRNLDITKVDLLINDRLQEQGGCYVSYMEHIPGLSGDSRGILLHSDDGLTDSIGKLVGQTAAENDRCSIPKGWDSVLRDLTISFKQPFYGEKNIYARATDDEGATSGWKQMGTWTVSAEEPPEPVAVRPYLGSSLRQTFDFDFTDVNGSDDIQSAEILIQFGRDTANACAMTLDRNAGVIHLDGESLKLNTRRAAAKNGQCAISDAFVTAQSRDGLHLSMSVEFDRSFHGRRNIYAKARDKAGLSSPWRWLGTWMVPGS